VNVELIDIHCFALIPFHTHYASLLRRRIKSVYSLHSYLINRSSWTASGFINIV